MKNTAVVILNWNGQKLLEQFLPSVMQHTPLDEVDIIVADNGSTDNSVSFLQNNYPTIQIQVFAENYGFAEGYNRALAELNYKYVILLNSDVEVTHDWVRTAVDYFETHPEVSALQPKILSYRAQSKFEYAGACGGFIDQNGYPFCRGRILSTVETDEGQYDTVVPIFWATGACLFIRLEDYKNAGGLDARFFAHQEEIDLCWRLNARGKKIVCLPQSVVYHVGGATLKVENPQKTYLNFRNNLLMLYKNLPQNRLCRVMLMRWIGDYLSALHFLLSGHIENAQAVTKARRDFKKMKKEYAKIRQENLQKTTDEMPATILAKSLIWEYYLRNHKKYGQLKP